MPGACLGCGLIQDGSGILSAYLCGGANSLHCTADGCLMVPGAVAVDRRSMVQSSNTARPAGDLGSGEVTVPVDARLQNPSGSVPMIAFVRYEISISVALNSDYWSWSYRNGRFMASDDGVNFYDIGQIVSRTHWDQRLLNDHIITSLAEGYTIPHIVPAGGTSTFRFYAAAATFDEYGNAVPSDLCWPAHNHQCAIRLIGVPAYPGVGIGS